ncbi:MAG: extracellular solute-binding protein [Deferrisomatales bacterium]|nr:extracellular solute-binding protein [Deferrisomatales bacterium]
MRGARRWNRLSVVLLLGLTAACQQQEKVSSIVFWTAEVEQDRLELQQGLALRFAATSGGVPVQVVPVDENVLPEKLAAAKAAGALPDVVELGLTQIVQFANQGILDGRAATAVVTELGRDSFYRGPLTLCGNPAGDGVAAVPIDGWVQGVWYRRDWLAENGLAPPTTWDDLLRAARALHEPQASRFGIVVGTHPQQTYTQQVFEQVALSNGARLYTADGASAVRSAKMLAAVEYYRKLAGAGPPGHTYWREARQYYLNGRAAMIWYSPYIIDDIAGLVAEHQPTVADLAGKTGFVPTLAGPEGPPTSYGEVYALGIPKGAAPAAADWVKFLLGAGYQEWLSMAPGGKIPVRRGAVQKWKEHPYFAHYQPGLADTLAAGMDRMERWGFFGTTAVPAIGEVTATKVVPEMLGKVISGEMDAAQGLIWLEQRLARLP